MGREVCGGSGSQLPILIDVDNQVDAASLMSCLPYFLGKGALRGKVVADQVGSSTKPILMIAMELTHLQLLYRADSFLTRNQVMEPNEYGEAYSTCTLPSCCPVNVANFDIVFTHAGFYQWLPKDIFLAVVVFGSNSMELEINRDIVLHFKARSILIRTEQSDPEYDREVEAISLTAMLRESLQLPHSEFPLILHAHLCAGPESGNRDDDAGQNKDICNAESQTSRSGSNQTILQSSESHTNIQCMEFQSGSPGSIETIQKSHSQAACCETSDQFMEPRPASAASNAAMESQTSKSEASIECRSVSAASVVTIECVCRSVSATSNVSIEYQSAGSESTDQTTRQVLILVKSSKLLSPKV